mmetsp:Transcript_13758/g.45455  ORF Transcript_13758/g.45455 Transcript_13758/m.45455 type:complete len:229 (-) Transcript_13758:732-1418(-)
MRGERTIRHEPSRPCPRGDDVHLRAGGRRRLVCPPHAVHEPLLRARESLEVKEGRVAPRVEQPPPEQLQPLRGRGEAADQVLVRLPARSHGVAEAERGEEGARRSAGEAAPLQRHGGHARPQRVGAGGVRVVPAVVHHQVGQRARGDKVGLGQLWDEAKPAGHAVCRRLRAQALLRMLRPAAPHRDAREPQRRLGTDNGERAAATPRGGGAARLPTRRTSRGRACTAG